MQHTTQRGRAIKRIRSKAVVKKYQQTNKNKNKKKAFPITTLRSVLLHSFRFRNRRTVRTVCVCVWAPSRSRESNFVPIHRATTARRAVRLHTVGSRTTGAGMQSDAVVKLQHAYTQSTRGGTDAQQRHRLAKWNRKFGKDLQRSRARWC